MGIFQGKTLGYDIISITRTISLTPEQDAIYMSIPSGKRSEFFGVALELAKNGKMPDFPIETNKEILKDIEADDEPKTIDDIKHNFDELKDK